MIIHGIGNDLFNGDGDVTRAEFAAIIVRALGLAENGDASMFDDVDEDEWYFGAVGKAFEYGVVLGRGNGIFDPESNITWQEAMIMIQRAAKIASYIGASGSLDGFDDANDVDDWAVDYVEWVIGSGLFDGEELRPLENITRAETAEIVIKLMRIAGLVDIRNGSQPDM